MHTYLAAPVMRMVLFCGGLAVASVSVYTGEAMSPIKRVSIAGQ